jgi:hypothetical protein
LEKLSAARNNIICMFIQYGWDDKTKNHKVVDTYRHVRLKTVSISGLGYAVVQWMRHCATNRKVAGSVPDGVIGIFH